MNVELALSLTYQWIKAGHVIFVIFWIAGMFMLPRYYVYHQEAAPGSAEEQRWIAYVVPAEPPLRVERGQALRPNQLTSFGRPGQRLDLR